MDIKKDAPVTSIRNHKSDTRGNIKLFNELYMFKATIKLVNMANSSILGEIFYFKVIHKDPALMSEIDKIFAHRATSDSNIIYHYQAMQQPNNHEFRIAMNKELKGQMANSNFIIVKYSKLPFNT